MTFSSSSLARVAMVGAAILALACAWWGYLQFFPTPSWLNAYHWRKASAYETWLKAGDHHKQVRAYEATLSAHGVANVLPMSELLSAARDWRGCAPEPFVVPPAELHSAIIGTLQIIARLNTAGNVIPSFSIASSYRAPDLNRCAGGASQSAHLRNVALDLDLNILTPFEELTTVRKLCMFWRTEGSSLKMGLGVYGGGRIHIDAAGYRTWGADYRQTSSPCR